MTSKLLRYIEVPFSGLTEKLASQITLSGNQRQWSNEILAQLYKQHSYLGEYSVNMDTLKKDENSGYLQGMFIVGPQQSSYGNAPRGEFEYQSTQVDATDAVTQQAQQAQQAPQQAQQAPQQAQQAPQQAQQQQQQQQDMLQDEVENVIRIPILVQASKLSTFDICILPDGTTDILTKRIVSEALAGTSSSFGVSTESTDSEGQGYGMSGAEVPNDRRYGSSNARVEKVAGLLDSVVADLPAKKAKYALDSIYTDPYLSRAANGSSHFSRAITKLIGSSQEKVASASIDIDWRSGLAKADTYLLEKSASGYTVTGVKRDPFEVVNVNFTRGMLATLQPTILRKLAENGSVLLGNSFGEKVASSTVDSGFAVVEKLGFYAVVNRDTGKMTEAAVVPSLISIRDGSPVPASLVLHKDGACVQEKVAGIRSSDKEFIPSDVYNYPVTNEYGVFILPDNRVTVPVLVKNILHDGEKLAQLVVQSDYIGEYTLTIGDVKGPMPCGHGESIFPETCKFVPLKKIQSNKFSKHVEESEKLATKREVDKEVTLYSNDGYSFSLSGKPVDSLHMDYRTGLNTNRAKILLGALGCSDKSANEKLASARTRREVTWCAPCSLVEGTQERPATVASKIPVDLREKVARDIGSWIPKVAAVLEDQDSVDTVLSLGFVTPENIQKYIDYAPDFVSTRKKLAELLLSVRLGIKNIPEAACLQAMRNIDRAVQGLELLSVRESGSDTITE